MQQIGGRVDTTVVEGARHIRLAGECDVSIASTVEAHLAGVIETGQTRIVFDLERVTFLDSSVLRIFLQARRDVAANGGEVTLLCRPGFVWRLLTLLEIDRLLRVCTPEEWREFRASVH